METYKKYLIPTLEILFFALIFYLSIIPLRDFDIWFHLKSGELIIQRGIVHYDVFSYNTAGREWFPYEWLFQVIVYKFQQWFGFESIKYLMAGMITVMVGAIYSIQKKIFKTPTFFTIPNTFIFYASVYEFLTARPHIFAYAFLIVNLFFILLYFTKGKNLLWLTLPITLIWTNLHGSIFLGVGFFAAYAFMSLINFYLSKKVKWLAKFKTLAIYTFVTGTLTILPPLGTLQYRLLWIFFRQRAFLSKFIDEWTSIITNPFAFRFYTISTILIFGFLSALQSC